MSSGALVDYEWLEDNVLQNREVQEALNDTAKRLLPIAQRLAYKEHKRRFAESLHVETGRRPGKKSPTGIKRPYARVVAGSEDANDTENGNIGYPKSGFFNRAAAQL